MLDLLLMQMVVNKGTKLRQETLHGRAHYVVPTVMMTPGVHTGSQGAILYTGDLLSKNVSNWNNKPLVVYHPEMNGGPISACDPAVLNSRSCGVVLNASYDNKLRTESWFDIDRTNEVDDRIIPRIINNEIIECSTGLILDVERTSGDLNGKTYTMVARNMAPDHLAVLPDKVGACSIQDGAGIFQLNQQSSEFQSHYQQVLQHFAKLGIRVGTNCPIALFTEPSLRSCALPWALNGNGWIEDVFSDFLYLLEWPASSIVSTIARTMKRSRSWARPKKSAALPATKIQPVKRS